MKNWINKWFSFSWKKLALVAALAVATWLVSDVDFGRVDAFNRDALQFLNSKSKIDQSLVTININGKNNNFTRPLSFTELKNLLDKILLHEPKNLIIALSNSDLYYSQNDIRQQLVDYLKPHKNAILYSIYVEGEDVAADEILKQHQSIRIDMFKDEESGPRDGKRRRLMIELDRIGPAKEFAALQKIGLKVKSPEDFKYPLHWWGAKMAFVKLFPEGTFGSYDAGWFVEQKPGSLNLKNKTVILGTNDEYSFLFSKSVFDLLGKFPTSDYKAFPIADSVANAINMYTTGDYMKVFPKFNDSAILFLVLITLIFLNLDIRKKITIFALLIPIALILTTTFYYITDFYINISRSLTLLFFLQYFAIPIVVLDVFKQQESKKLQEINDVRIDALLAVSEKVAHDIRSPLSAINLVMSKASFPDQEYKDIFDSAVQRIDETANKILTRYRTKTGSENETAEPIDLGEICNSIIKEKTILNEKINFELVINTDSTMAMGLKLDLERIISNIMDNSIFALKSIIEPKIFLSIAEHDKMLRLSITDNGTGIPEKVLSLLGTARITTKADTGQGNGIGLLHAKRVIERLNGHFEISSQENVGTTINISLPKA